MIIPKIDAITVQNALMHFVINAITLSIRSDERIMHHRPDTVLSA